MILRNRIKEFRRVRGRDLLANPKRYRSHPSAQRAALQESLEEFGIVAPLLVRETPEGLELIDGHMRADSDPDQLWPVLILDVNESESDLLLAAVDGLKNK